MKFIKFLFLVTILSNIQPLLAQSPVLSAGNIQTVEIHENEISFSTTNAYGKIAVYTPSIVRVRLDKKPLGRDFSYAVIAQPQQNKVKITQDDKSIIILTDSLKAVVNKAPFGIAFYTTDGQLINQDEPGLTTSWVGDEVTSYKTMMPNERFIGLGEKNGNLDRFGSGYTNWNSDVYGYSIEQDPLYSAIPFYIGLHHHLNYGIFLDNTYQTDFNFGASNNRFSSFGARGGEMNYYFIYNKNLADIITSYTTLTGRMKMPPLWSLGYQQNRYTYYPDTEVMRIAQTLREKKIPADGITLDIHYMDQYQLFTWDKNRFPDPVGLSANLNRLGFKLTVIVDPGIKVRKGAKAYESGAKDSVFIKYPDKAFYTGQVWPGWCNFTDFTSEKGRAWWKNQVKFFSDNGVSGIWNDMNEIATWGSKMPSNVLFDFDGAPASHLQAHNVYALEMARSSYEGAKQHFKERPFILTRSGYAGLQRYSAIWTGDNRAEESHMLAGVRLLNSLGLSGVPFTGMDIGGFTGNPSVPLYIKWMELGAFIPYYRNHTGFNSRSAEPWVFGEDALPVVRNYVNLRYKLLPYIYSTFYEASQNGLPVMRSLAINYPFDANIYDTTFQNEYMFGNSFLVAPFESTKEFGKVYLPEGSWYNLYSDEKLQGGQPTIQTLSVGSLPVFVKESSIVPMQSLVQTTAEPTTDTLYLHIYNGSVAHEFVYYEDDGKSDNYLNGDYYKRSVKFNPAKHGIVLNAVQGNFASKFHHVKLIMHGFNTITQAKVNDKAVTVTSGQYKMVPALTGNSYTKATDIDDKNAAKVYNITFGLLNQEQTISY